MSGHPSLDLTASVRVLNDGDAWELGSDLLDVDTVLGAPGDVGGALLDLTDDLVEVAWEQGSQDALSPPAVLPHPDAGVADILLWDPNAEYLPDPGNLTGGIRPGRPVQIGVAGGGPLFTGIVESVTHQSGGGDSAPITLIRCVDQVTRIQTSGVMPPAARPTETPADRATWILDTFTPDIPAIIDPAADGDGHDMAIPDAGQSPWDALTDAADAEIGLLLTHRDGSVELRAHDNFGYTPVTQVPDCAPVTLGDLTLDLIALRNDIAVRRRNVDADTEPFSTDLDPNSAAHYGRVTFRWDESPHATAAGQQRAATQILVWYAYPQATRADLNVNVTAAASTPHLDALLWYVTDLQAGDILTIADGTYARVFGWSWTWTAAGALAGRLILGRAEDVQTTAGWLLGIPQRSNLGLSTTLAA